MAPPGRPYQQRSTTPLPTSTTIFTTTIGTIIDEETTKNETFPWWILTLILGFAVGILFHRYKGCIIGYLWYLVSLATMILGISIFCCGRLLERKRRFGPPPVIRV